MEVILYSMQAIAVPLLVGLLGFAVLHRRMIDGAHLKVLAVLALDIALPCHVLVTLLDRFDPHSMPDWWNRPLWWAGSVLFFGITALVGSRFFARKIRREATVSLFYPNAVFLPMVILMELFSPDTQYLTDLFLFTLFFAMFYFNTIGLIYGCRQGRIKLFNPVMIATLCGLLLKLLRIDFIAPEFVRSGLRLVGAMAAPALLILLGGNIYMDLFVPSAVKWRDTAIFVCWKNVAIPLLMLSLIFVLRPDPPIALLLLLHAVVPPLTSLPTMTERCGGQREVVGRFMVGSFAASLVTVPAFLYVFSLLYAVEL